MHLCCLTEPRGGQEFSLLSGVLLMLSFRRHMQPRGREVLLVSCHFFSLHMGWTHHLIVHAGRARDPVLPRVSYMAPPRCVFPTCDGINAPFVARWVEVQRRLFFPSSTSIKGLSRARVAIADHCARARWPTSERTNSDVAIGAQRQSSCKQLLCGNVCGPSFHGAAAASPDLPSNHPPSPCARRLQRRSLCQSLCASHWLCLTDLKVKHLCSFLLLLSSHVSAVSFVVISFTCRSSPHLHIRLFF